MEVVYFFSCNKAECSFDWAPHFPIVLCICPVVLQLVEQLSPLDVFLGLMAAAAHDVDHPGVNQPFLIKTQHHLASLYQVQKRRVKPLNFGRTVSAGSAFCMSILNPMHVVQNTSVLESHHWRSTVGMLRESGLLSHLPADMS